MIEGLAYVGFYGYGYYSKREAFMGVVCPKHMAKELFELLEDEFYMSELDGKHSETLCDPVIHTDLDKVVEAIYKTKYDMGELYVFKQDERLDPYVDELNKLNERVKQLDIKPVTKYSVYDGSRKVL